MRKWLLIFCLLLPLVPLKAQEELRSLLIAGLEDSRTYANDYLRPATEAAMFSLSNGWYQSAEVKGFLGFEFSIIGNVSVGLSDHQTFFLNTEDYQNLEFTDGALGKNVATIFGANDPAIEVRSFYESSSGDQDVSIFNLPQGIGSGERNYFPLAFLQGRLGVIKGTEIKVRYFPKIKYNDVEAQLIGGAVQHEITSWLPASDLLPIAVSGLVGYTQLDGEYDFTDQDFLEGEGQILSAEMHSWLVAGIISTKIPVFNVYGGIGYAGGRSEISMLGSYDLIDQDSGATILSVDDPLTVSHEIGGMVANLGVSVKLGVLKIHADYNYQDYQTVSVGFHVGL